MKNKGKFISLENLKELLDDVLRHPSLLGIKLGCNCGCGGDYLTSEDWKEYNLDYEQGLHKLKELFKDSGIELDWDTYE